MKIRHCQLFSGPRAGWIEKLKCPRSTGSWWAGCLGLWAVRAQKILDHAISSLKGLMTWNTNNFITPWEFLTLTFISCIRQLVAQELDGNRINVIYARKFWRMPTSGVGVLWEGRYSACSERVLVRIRVLRGSKFFVRSHPQQFEKSYLLRPAHILRASPALFPSQTCTCHCASENH